MYSLIWRSVMWRPGKLRFLIGVKNPLPIRPTATARKHGPLRGPADPDRRAVLILFAAQHRRPPPAAPPGSPPCRTSALDQLSRPIGVSVRPTRSHTAV